LQAGGHRFDPDTLHLLAPLPGAAHRTASLSCSGWQEGLRLLSRDGMSRRRLSRHRRQAAREIRQRVAGLFFGPRQITGLAPLRKNAGVRSVFTAVLLLALAGCGSSHSRLPAGAIALRTLPAQGLIAQERGGIALRDLHGRSLAWLPRFSVYPSSAAAQASLDDDFLSARLYPPLLHGPRGWYRLDVPRHALMPVQGARVPLAGGAGVVAKPRQAFTVERGGQVVLRGSVPNFRVLSPRLVQAGTTLLDVTTGRRWTLPPGCLAAGLHGDVVIVACGVAHGAEAAARLVLERLDSRGVGHPLAPALAQLIPESGSLSPNQQWVAVEGDTGCAASYVYVAAARGGGARLVYGKSPREPFASNYSSLLGWSADGRLVAQITPRHCDEPYGPQHPPNGVYLVDPRTLARTFVTRTADAMWSSRG
jgi:hypothetical protein